MKGKEMKKFGLLRNEGFDKFEFEETVAGTNYYQVGPTFCFLRGKENCVRNIKGLFGSIFF